MWDAREEAGMAPKLLIWVRKWVDGDAIDKGEWSNMRSQFGGLKLFRFVL